jgi:hypothetical protein
VLLLLLGGSARYSCGRSGSLRGTPGLGLYLIASSLLLCQTRFFLGHLPGLGLPPSRFLSGREDRNLLLLAAFGFTPGGVALLFVQRALPRGQFGRRQRAPRTRRRPPRGNRHAWCRGRARGWRGRCTGCGGRISCHRGTRLAHLHFDDL